MLVRQLTHSLLASLGPRQLTDPGVKSIGIGLDLSGASLFQAGGSFELRLIAALLVKACKLQAANEALGRAQARLVGEAGEDSPTRGTVVFLALGSKVSCNPFHAPTRFCLLISQSSEVGTWRTTFIAEASGYSVAGSRRNAYPWLSGKQEVSRFPF